MKWTKEEAEEQLVGLRQIIRAMRKRREILDIQWATQGIQTPPQIMIEISTLTEHISVREREIEQLEMYAVEDRMSLADAEFRSLVIDAWATPQGRPTVAGETKLERERLRLGITPEQATDHINFVRSALFEELLLDVNVENLFSRDSARVRGEVERIAKAFQLDKQRTLATLQALSSPTETKSTSLPQELFFLINNRIWANKDDRETFIHFVKQLRDRWPQAPEAENGTIIEDVRKTKR